MSNFHHSPLIYDNRYWDTAEHAYQAAKTNVPGEKEAVHMCPTARDAKKMGKRVTVRPDWDEVKVDVMYEIVKAKFHYNPELRERLLLTTGFELEEGNWWGDRFWGVCDGEGLNNLGKILMRIRDEYNEQTVRS